MIIDMVLIFRETDVRFQCNCSSRNCNCRVAIITDRLLTNGNYRSQKCLKSFPKVVWITFPLDLKMLLGCVYTSDGLASHQKLMGLLWPPHISSHALFYRMQICLKKPKQFNFKWNQSNKCPVIFNYASALSYCIRQWCSHQHYLLCSNCQI